MNRGKRIVTLLSVLILGIGPVWATEGKTRAVASGVSLNAEIHDGMLMGTLSFSLENIDQENPFPALDSTVALVSEVLPRNMKILPPDDSGMYRIGATKSLWGGRRSGRVELKFTTAQTNSLAIRVPVTPIRKFEIAYKPDDYDVRVENAGNTEKILPTEKSPLLLVRGNLPMSDHVKIAWTPAATRFKHSDSVVSCKALTTSWVSPGVIHHTSEYVFKITQGTTRQYAFQVPKHVNIVNTDTDFGLLKQTIEDSKDAAYSILTLTSQTESSGAVIRLVYEDALPAFPSRATIEPISPQGVLRTDGLLSVVAKGSVRIQPRAMKNLLQTDGTAIPLDKSTNEKDDREGGTRNWYRYTTTPCSLEVGLEDIVTAIHAENTIIVDVGDAQASVEAALQLDLRDAPADKIVVTIGEATGWTITSVTGKNVADGDVEQRDKGKGIVEVTIPFEKQVSGTMLISLKMERKIDTTNPGTLAVPEITLKDAVVQNGYIVAAASQGIQLAGGALVNLSEIHAASTPVNKPGAQLAYRFRGEEWALAIGFTRAKTSIHSEVLHLVSPGDGMLYASAAASFHVSGAPADTFKFWVPEYLKQIEVTCADLDNWSRTGDVLTVKLSRRIMGDWTMLISYEQQLDYHGGELTIGEITTMGTESERGFIVLAGPASLKAEEASALPDTMIRIGKEEIPEGYSATLLSPVTAAWKYMRAPHIAKIKLTPLATENILGQVVDFLSIESNITRGGASVTKARYSVKNARGQYLTLKLPEKAKLWAVNKLSEDGNVAAEIPSQLDGGLLLVPVERPRDPNRATTIEIQYATDNSASSKHQKLQAPVVVGAPITFAEWKLTVGDKLAVRRAKGNLSPDAGGSKLRFTRTSIMPEDKPLELEFAVVPIWLAQINMINAISFTLVFVGFGVASFRSRRRIWLVLAVAALLALVSELGEMGKDILPSLCGIGVLGLVSYGIVRRTARCLVGVATRREMPPPLSKTQKEKQTGEDGGMKIGLMVALSLVVASVLAVPASLDYAGELAGNQAAVDIRSDRITVAVVPPSKEAPNETSLRVTHELDLSVKTAGAYAYPVIADKGAGSFVVLDSEMPEGLTLVYGSMNATDSAGPYTVFVGPSIAGGQLFFIAEKPGDYKIKFTISKTGNVSGFTWKTFRAMKTTVSIAMPRSELQVACEGLSGKTETTEPDGTTVLSGFLAEAMDLMRIKITPKQRDNEKEKVVMSADVSTYAAIRSGVVDVTTSIKYRVLQGVVRKVEIRIPDTLHVVDLGGDVSEWSFDNVTRILSVAVKDATPEGFAVFVRCNAVAKNFPYACKLSVPDVLGVTRQNGKLGIAASESVLLTLADNVGCTVMRNEDFSGILIPWLSAQDGKVEKVRRAFRYDEAAKVGVTVSADSVKPELRSVLTESLSIGDERNTLSAQIELSVAKAGVFLVNLSVPKDYVIENITGERVVSWDDRRKTDGGVEVMFGNSFEGVTQIFVVLSRQQQGVAETVEIPRLSLAGEAKQTGRVSVTAERGVKLTLDVHEGVVSSRTEEVSAAQKNTVSLDIVRANWTATLKTQVLDPVVKPDVLQSISIAEGMLQHRVYMRCKIENAGVKQFRVVVPTPGASLTVSGRHIARVVPDGKPEADGSQTWLIELQGKVDNEYAATCFYQEQYDSTTAVTVKPLRIVGAQRQTGWVVVFGDGRIKVDADVSTTGLRAEDARTIPDSFGAGDLSSALKCWKILDANTSFALKVTRHSSAAVLPAFVESLKLTTVLSIGGRTLTQTDIKFSVGRLRFLRVVLPGKTSDLWTAQVNGAPVTVSTEEGGVLCIPLDSVPEGDTAQATFVWASQPAEKIGGELGLESPRFPDLPLRNINWSFYAPDEYSYTLKNQDFDEAGSTGSSRWLAISSFDVSQYEQRNKVRSEGVLQQAKSSFDNVGQMLDSGERGKAQRALKQAIDLSQADTSLNEDARVQFENVARQNANIGFMNRRDALRISNNIYDEKGGLGQASAGFNGGNFSREFAQQLESQLSARDRNALELVSAKIVSQQAAVEETAPAITITMPEHGYAFVFTRALQTQPGGGMKLELSSHRKLATRVSGDRFRSWALFFCVVPFMWILLRFAFGKQKVVT